MLPERVQDAFRTLLGSISEGLGVSQPLLSVSCASLGRCWALLGRVLIALGRLLAGLGRLLGASWLSGTSLTSILEGFWLVWTGLGALREQVLSRLLRTIAGPT